MNRFTVRHHSSHHLLEVGPLIPIFACAVGAQGRARKQLTVGAIQKDLLASIAPAGEVINCPGKLQRKRPCHGALVSAQLLYCKSWPVLCARALFSLAAHPSLLTGFLRSPTLGFGHSKTKPSEILREGDIYVICEEDEDLREPLKLIGEDRIMLGSDMPHSESHPNSFQKFQKQSDLSAGMKAKILNDNARQFFSR